ncbi:BMP family ABC transporter substrate-binding protein [Virgibacillus siamensis]|uniref:BMP family ABC transporter substrate-binding protein n=1 Tax=Virgibacillus siamensis TaxID=480071 RepID=UPI003184273D
MRILKKIFIVLLAVSGITILLYGCTSNGGDLQKVGMLVENSVHDNAWSKQGYKGLLNINKEFDVEVFYKENIKTKQQVIEAVDELAKDGVNLIFGHSNTYGKYFVELAPSYPEIHFVYFNGGQFGEDVTSLNFNSHAMGFFAGMVAGKMTETGHVGVIGAFEWQPEIEGFYEGVKYQNPEVDVTIQYVNSWNDPKAAMKHYQKMRKNGADVFYPTGDLFSVKVLKKVSSDGLYGIGYVTDQSYIDNRAILTSTVQHVSKLYVRSAEKFNEGKLRGGVLTYDFQDEVISLSKFSPVVPEDFQEKMNDEIEQYKESALLPNER